MYDDDEELDRAIFALPLAPVPAGMHATIMRSTVYAVGHPVAMFATREIAAIGAAVAVAVWLAAYAIASPAFDARVAFEIGSVARSLAEAQTLTWLAAGAAVALVANNALGFRLPRPSERKRA
jgi:hypothetical protein